MCKEKNFKIIKWLAAASLSIVIVFSSILPPVLSCLAADTEVTSEEGTTQNKESFHYEHDPMENPKAAKDIVVNPDAVYGYSPNPESTRLGSYADAIDWTDEAQVADARAQRRAYIDETRKLYLIVEEMLGQGADIEEIARAVSRKRNELRLEAYKDDPEGLELVKKSNLETYGDENGPTADSLYEKYGSWQTVLEKAFSTNAGMDACLGFYDECYDTYDILDQIPAESSNAEETDNTYVVQRGDCLWSIAENKLGSGYRWKEIYELNKDSISNPSLIYPGQELVLPAA